MTLTFSFDDNEISAEDPLGSVTLSEGSAHLYADTVWLDAFFSAMVEGYLRCLRGEDGVVEVEGEIEPLKMQRRETGLVVGYGKEVVSIKSIVEFDNCLRETCSLLLKSLPGNADGNPLFNPVRNFLKMV